VQLQFFASVQSALSRRVITISKKKWGKSATKTEKLIRDAVPKPDVLKGIDEYLAKARSVTCYDLASRFNIRMSVARKVLREKESKGEVIPYIRESGFVVYTTPAEVEKRKGGVPIMISDALEEVASSVNSEPVITEEMDLALAAAGAPGSVKPSKLARKRREAGEKKESRKDTRPEVIVEPLEEVAMRHPETTIETPKAAPLKEPVSKEVASEKEAKPKKAAEKKEAKPKKAAEKKEAKPKKAAEKKEAKPKKAASNKKSE
jgi:ribosomal protein S25